MKILFLDIDGVLNSEAHFIRRHEARKGRDPNTETIEEWRDTMIDPEAVKWLNHITDSTDAKIVVSSSWRVSEDTNDCLRRCGVTGAIIGRTGKHVGRENGGRGAEIQEWLDFHAEAVTHFVILDDDQDMLKEQLPHFVHTSFITGLTEEYAKEAIKILSL